MLYRLFSTCKDLFFTINNILLYIDLFIRCLFIITRQLSNEQQLTQVDAEPTTISLLNNIPPQATDVACLILPSRSRTNSIITSYNERSRANSRSSIDSQNDRQIII